MDDSREKVKWSGIILSIQPRTTVWRYVLDNRTHYHIGLRASAMARSRANFTKWADLAASHTKIEARATTKVGLMRLFPKTEVMTTDANNNLSEAL